MDLWLYVIFYLSVLLWRCNSKRLKCLLLLMLALAQFVNFYFLFSIPPLVCLPMFFLRGAQIFIIKNYFSSAKVFLSGLIYLGDERFVRARFLLIFFAEEAKEQPHFIIKSHLEETLLKKYISLHYTKIDLADIEDQRLRAFFDRCSNHL